MKNTIHKSFFQISAQRSNSPAINYRKNSAWAIINYSQASALVQRLSQGLIYLTSTTARQNIAILSENRWEWLITDLGIMTSSHITVPLHTNNSIDTNNYILRHCLASTLFISDTQLKSINLQKLLNKTFIKNIIIYSSESLNNFSKLKPNFSKIKLIKFNQLLKSPSSIKNKNLINQKFNQQDTCSIIYTSGTTGNPKGVVLTHYNLLSNVQQIQKIIPTHTNDKFLSFLPYSHALEHTAGFLIPFLNGAQIFIVDEIQKIGEYAKEVKPTILVAVPRILGRVHDKILDKINISSRLKQKIFHWALTTNPKKKNLARKIADKLVFQKIKNNLGGQLRLVISGGSSLAPEIAQFFHTIGLNILEGYGLTETSPIIAANRLNQVKIGTVGPAIPDTQVKINSDRELLVQGPQVFSQYYKNEIETQKSFENNWFKTGDLAEIDDQGFIKIIGRKKEIIVLSTGHNIAPPKVENALDVNKYIQQSLVYGDNEKYLKALIVPDFAELKAWLKNKNKNISAKWEQVYSDLEVQRLFKEQINLALKNLGKHEQVGAFKLLSRPFLAEKNELTPTLKLKRRNILEHFLSRQHESNNFL